MPDYIHSADAEFNAWQQNFATVANSSLAELVACKLTLITAA